MVNQYKVLNVNVFENRYCTHEYQHCNKIYEYFYNLIIYGLATHTYKQYHCIYNITK